MGWDFTKRGDCTDTQDVAPASPTEKQIPPNEEKVCIKNTISGQFGESTV
eukprot:NODE_1273_length_1208_cov_72.229508_g1042_i0.p2 GENE.NODE_1273_length_1208_cov_72.229508_g1042_i0~~NODE_1273_length_1208_cov_72.229508_g1042_i0.p2  ORF type:complete len:50 (-),score=6.92 NODE_1273_length_1208_cov_72.229508_g1042_i0:387-536(-)